jgi:hypothetical protein
VRSTLEPMPRVLLDVSKEWLDRWQAVTPASIEAMKSWERQIQCSLLESNPEPGHLLEILLSQIMDTRRNLESARHLF